MRRLSISAGTPSTKGGGKACVVSASDVPPSLSRASESHLPRPREEPAQAIPAALPFSPASSLPASPGSGGSGVCTPDSRGQAGAAGGPQGGRRGRKSVQTVKAGQSPAPLVAGSPRGDRLPCQKEEGSVSEQKDLPSVSRCSASPAGPPSVGAEAPLSSLSRSRRPSVADARSPLLAASAAVPSATSALRPSRAETVSLTGASPPPAVVEPQPAGDGIAEKASSSRTGSSEEDQDAPGVFSQRASRSKEDGRDVALLGGQDERREELREERGRGRRQGSVAESRLQAPASKTEREGKKAEADKKEETGKSTGRQRLPPSRCRHRVEEPRWDEEDESELSEYAGFASGVNAGFPGAEKLEKECVRSREEKRRRRDEKGNETGSPQPERGGEEDARGAMRHGEAGKDPAADASGDAREGAPLPEQADSEKECAEKKARQQPGRTEESRGKRENARGEDEQQEEAEKKRGKKEDLRKKKVSSVRRPDEEKEETEVDVVMTDANEAEREAVHAERRESAESGEGAEAREEKKRRVEGREPAKLEEAMGEAREAQSDGRREEDGRGPSPGEAEGPEGLDRDSHGVCRGNLGGDRGRNSHAEKETSESLLGETAKAARQLEEREGGRGSEVQQENETEKGERRRGLKSDGRSKTGLGRDADHGKATRRSEKPPEESRQQTSASPSSTSSSSSAAVVGTESDACDASAEKIERGGSPGRAALAAPAADSLQVCDADPASACVGTLKRTGECSAEGDEVAAVQSHGKARLGEKREIPQGAVAGLDSERRRKGERKEARESSLSVSGSRKIQDAYLSDVAAEDADPGDRLAASEVKSSASSEAPASPGTAREDGASRLAATSPSRSQGGGASTVATRSSSRIAAKTQVPEPASRREEREERRQREDKLWERVHRRRDSEKEEKGGEIRYEREEKSGEETEANTEDAKKGGERSSTSPESELLPSRQKSSSDFKGPVKGSRRGPVTLFSEPSAPPANDEPSDAGGATPSSEAKLGTGRPKRSASAKAFSAEKVNRSRKAASEKEDSGVHTPQNSSDASRPRAESATEAAPRGPEGPGTSDDPAAGVVVSGSDDRAAGSASKQRPLDLMSPARSAASPLERPSAPVSPVAEAVSSASPLASQREAAPARRSARQQQRQAALATSLSRCLEGDGAEYVEAQPRSSKEGQDSLKDIAPRVADAAASSPDSTEETPGSDASATSADPSGGAAESGRRGGRGGSGSGASSGCGAAVETRRSLLGLTITNSPYWSRPSTHGSAAGGSSASARGSNGDAAKAGKEGRDSETQAKSAGSSLAVRPRLRPGKASNSASGPAGDAGASGTLPSRRGPGAAASPSERACEKKAENRESGEEHRESGERERELKREASDEMAKNGGCRREDVRKARRGEEEKRGKADERERRKAEEDLEKESRERGAKKAGHGSGSGTRSGLLPRLRTRGFGREEQGENTDGENEDAGLSGTQRRDFLPTRGTQSAKRSRRAAEAMAAVAAGAAAAARERRRQGSTRHLGDQREEEGGEEREEEGEEDRISFFRHEGASSPESRQESAALLGFSSTSISRDTSPEKDDGGLRSRRLSVSSLQREEEKTRGEARETRASKARRSAVARDEAEKREGESEKKEETQVTEESQKDEGKEDLKELERRRRRLTRGREEENEWPKFGRGRTRRASLLSSASLSRHGNGSRAAAAGGDEQEAYEELREKSREEEKEMKEATEKDEGEAGGETEEHGELPSSPVAVAPRSTRGFTCAKRQSPSLGEASRLLDSTEGEEKREGEEKKGEESGSEGPSVSPSHGVRAAPRQSKHEASRESGDFEQDEKKGEEADPDPGDAASAEERGREEGGLNREGDREGDEGEGGEEIEKKEEKSLAGTEERETETGEGRDDASAPSADRDRHSQEDRHEKRKAKETSADRPADGEEKDSVADGVVRRTGTRLSAARQMTPKNEEGESAGAKKDGKQAEEGGGEVTAFKAVIAKLVAFNEADKVRYPQWYTGPVGAFEPRHNQLCWWRFRVQAKYQPGRVVMDFNEEIRCGRLTEAVKQQLFVTCVRRTHGTGSAQHLVCRSNTDETGGPAEPPHIGDIVIVQNLEDLKFSVCNWKVTKPLPFPAGEMQVRLERASGSALGVLNSLTRAKKFLQIREKYSGLQFGSVESLEKQLLDILAREHLKPTLEIVAHLQQVDVGHVLQTYTSMPPGWDWTAFQKEQDRLVAQRRRGKADASAALEDESAPSETSGSTGRLGQAPASPPFGSSSPFSSSACTARSSGAKAGASGREDAAFSGASSLRSAVGDTPTMSTSTFSAPSASPRRVVYATLPPHIAAARARVTLGAGGAGPSLQAIPVLSSLTQSLASSSLLDDDSLSLLADLPPSHPLFLNLLNQSREPPTPRADAVVGALPGLSGQWIRMLSQLILRRDALLHLLQPVSLDLLHNPTRVFGPLPALLPPDLLLQVSLATGDAGPACHLLTANLYLARLADNAAVRTLDPAQKRIRVLQSSRAETADRSSFAERLLGARDEKRARKWSAERHTDAEKPHRPKKKRRRDPNEPPRRRGRPP
ncbi:hypothetical protein TGP89_309250A, partial [Toxoplasma gondii p89]